MTQGSRTTVTIKDFVDLGIEIWIPGDDAIWLLPASVTIIKTETAGMRDAVIRFQGIAWEVGIYLNHWRRAYPVGEMVQLDDNSTYYIDCEYRYKLRTPSRVTSEFTRYGFVRPEDSE